MNQESLAFSDGSVKLTAHSSYPNHPYWQTADYHALEGYLETIRQSPELITEGAKVELRISGRKGISSIANNLEIIIQPN
jgi:hypothetical protein